MNAKPKVLIIYGSGLANGGVESVIMNLIRSLHTFYTFDILVYTEKKQYHDEEFLSYGGEIIRFPLYPAGSLIRKRLDYYFGAVPLFLFCARLFKTTEYKIVHCNNVHDGSPALLAAKKAGINVRIAHGHSMPSKDHFIRTIFNNIYKKITRISATHYIGCSDEVCRELFDLPQAYTINNPYNEKIFNYSPNKVDGIQLIQIGRFCETKNQLFSLKVLKCILPMERNTTLSLVGANNSAYEKVIRKYIIDNDLAKNVRIYPTSANIPELLSKTNAFLMPSISEGFGIAAIEAQSVGLCCYMSASIPQSTNCGACSYLSIEDEKIWANRIHLDYKKGKLVHQKHDCSKFNSSSFAEAISKIYEGKDFR